MKPKGDTRRTAFPAAVRPIMLGISGVVLCAGCATDSTVGIIRGGGHGSVELAGLEPGCIAVAMAPAPALFRFDPAEGKLDSSGRRAGELAADVLGLPPMGDPLFQTAASPLAFAAAPFAAAYGAIAGAKRTLPPEKYWEAEAELAQGMAAMTSQDHLRKWFLASAGERTRLTVAPSETLQRPQADAPVSAIVETRVEELRLQRKGKRDTSYALTIKSRARVLRASDGAVLYDKPFEYESKEALFLDWTRGDGLASVAQTGFRALAEQMVESTLCAPPAQALFTGAGYRKQGRPGSAPVGTSVAQFVKLVPDGAAQPGSARAYSVSNSARRISAGFPGAEDSFAVFSTRSQPGLTFQEPISRELAGPAAVADTDHFLDGTQDFPNAVIQISACVAAIPVGLWNQGAAIARAVPQKRLAKASAALRKAALDIRPDVELVNHVTQNLGPNKARPALMVSDSPTGGGPRSATSDRRLEPETALEIHVRKAGLTGGKGVNPKLALEMDLQVRLFRTADGKDICSYPVHYRTEGRRYTSWAADDARLFRAESARCYGEVSKAITHHLVSQGFVAPLGTPAPILVQR